LRQKLLREGKVVRHNAVLGHQDPTRQALTHFMESIARRDLRGLHREPLAEAMQLLFQPWELRDELPQRLGVAAVGCTVSLSYESGRTAAVAHQKRQTGEALAANEADLDALSVRLHRQHGNHSVIHEVSGLDGLAGFINDLVKLEPDQFQLRKHRVEFFT